MCTTHTLTCGTAPTGQHVHSHHMHVCGPQGTRIIGGEAAKWTGPNCYLLASAGARCLIPFGIRQLCGRLSPQAQRRPPTCPDLMVRPSRTKSSLRAHPAPQKDSECQNRVLSLTPTQGEQLEQEREAGRERGGRGVRSSPGGAAQSGAELAGGQGTWSARPKEHLVG